MDTGTSQVLSIFNGFPGLTRFKLDAGGRVVMIGQTQGPTTPGYTANAIDACRRVGMPLLGRLDVDGKTVVYESNADFGSALAIDESGNAYVASGNHVEKIDFTTESAHTISCIEPSGSFTGAPIAPGQMVNLWGNAIGPPDAIAGSFDESGRLPTSLGGARVLFNGIAAPLLFAGPNQVNAIVPFEIAGAASANVEIEEDGQKAAQGSALVAAAGSQILGIVNQDGSTNSINHPASPGDIITIYSTGGGQTNPPSIDGQIAAAPASLVLSTDVVLLDGNGVQQTRAEVLYSGAAPGQVAGIVQVNVKLPDVLPAPPSPVLPTLNVALAIGHPDAIVAAGQLFVTMTIPSSSLYTNF
jgi:uncharacterized protein (TIGR03437 family)